MAETVETDHGPGWVKMYHPGNPKDENDDPVTTEVTQEAYDEVWADKGWKTVEPAAAGYDKMKKDQLIAEAERLGLDSSGTADEIRARLTGEEA